MNQAHYMGTVPLNFLNRSQTNWGIARMEDIIADGYITKPDDHLFTLGSSVASWMTSLATTPAYPLPTQSQIYTAGRDVFRWGGTNDPYEIDFDRYGFTPDYYRGIAVMWKAPKSEPHHLSELPQILVNVPGDWQEICRAILNRQL